jgi:hypothetical protein
MSNILPVQRHHNAILGPDPLNAAWRIDLSCRFLPWLELAPGWRRQLAVKAVKWTAVLYAPEARDGLSTVDRLYLVAPSDVIVLTY